MDGTEKAKVAHIGATATTLLGLIGEYVAPNTPFGHVLAGLLIGVPAFVTAAQVYFTPNTPDPAKPALVQPFPGQFPRPKD